jgi:DNA (cytosine-5)-methyltransferase 3A
MNILSLFDGMSCSQIALNRAGISYENYFSSEIDKYAIKITQKNYPKTIQLGDVTNIKGSDLPKIELLIGGSPCQGFSFAGDMLNFDDDRSKLFFEFVRLLKECKPKYFLLENVRMITESENVISKFLGVKPIKLNSSLVSAQNRVRNYWTNIGPKQVDMFGNYSNSLIPQPKDKGLVLADIIESEIPSNTRCGKIKRLFNTNPSQLGLGGYVYGIGGKSPTLTINKGDGIKIFKSCRQVAEADINGHDLIKRVYYIGGKSPTLNSGQGGNREPKIIVSRENWRKLTPLECERLQTVPDNYTEGVSNAQRYKMLGNGFTVDIIVHILNYI